ncbi:CoA transferase subunit A [Streptomyces sp. NPDC001984]
MGWFASLDDVTDHLRSARRVGLGGMLLENKPSALVRELIAVGGEPLWLTSGPASSWDVDVLAAAGRLHTLRVPHVSLGSLGLAPALRRLAQSGAVALEECEEAILLGSLMAGGARASFQPLEHLGHNDVVDGNPLLVGHDGLRGVEPVRLDVALLHASAADEHGNLVHRGSRWADLLLARCAARVIVTVEQRVTVDEASRLGVTVPGYLTHEVIEAPFGAHPLGSVGRYSADLEHLRHYRDRVLAGKGDAYVREYGSARPAAYAALVGTDRFAALQEAAG